MRAQWTPTEGQVRDDDPYHAWQYKVRPDVEDGNPAERLCPVLIRAKAGEPETFAALARSIEKIAAEVGGGRFHIGDQEGKHLIHSLSWINSLVPGEGQPGGKEVGEDAEYARLFLVYMEEDRRFGSDTTTETEHYEILFTGAAIRDVVRNPINTQAAGRQRDDRPATMLAIIDDSFAFLNEAFVEMGLGPLRSRWSGIWFQDVEKVEEGEASLKVGYFLGQPQIEEILNDQTTRSEWEIYQDKAPPTAEDFVPLDLASERYQPLAASLSHGTHVASRALAVFDAENAGAQQLHLYGVSIPVEVTEDTSGSVMGSYALAAVRQAMMWNDEFYMEENWGSNTQSVGADSDAAHDRSADVPLVMNFSYGFQAGPKDGTHPLTAAIARVINARNAFWHPRPTALVVPMGNSYEARGVAHAEAVTRDEPLKLDWVLLPDDHTSSFLEIYARGKNGDGALDLGIELVAPDRRIARLSVRLAEKQECWELRHDTGSADGSTVAMPAGEWSVWPTADGSVWSRRGFIALGPTASHDDKVATVPYGAWQLTVSSKDSTPVEVLVLVQRDEAPGTYPGLGRQSYLDARHASVETVHNGQPVRDYSEIAPPLSRSFTGSILASSDSDYVFAVGAGMERTGDGIDPDSLTEVDPEPQDASPYSSSGPRFVDRKDAESNGPDMTGLADRSQYFRGVFAAGTWSGAQIAMSGSSVAAPEFSGFLAAHPNAISAGRGCLNSVQPRRPEPEAQAKAARLGLSRKRLKELIESLG